MISERGGNDGFSEKGVHLNSLVPVFNSDAMPAPKLVYDNDTFEILHCNSAAAAFLGYSRKDLVCLNLRDICINDFSMQRDTGLVDFPINKINRLVRSKSKLIYSCETKDYEIDFETSVLVFRNIISLNVFSMLQLLN